MPIKTVQITNRQRDTILKIEENHFADLKAKEIKPAKLTQVVSAFANADGGELYIGIAEISGSPKTFKWDGFPDVEAANGHIQIFETLFPLGEDYSYTFLSHPNETGLVLQVQVRKTRSIVKASDGIPYIRRGAQKLPVDTEDKLKRLERNKGITSFENEPISVEISEITNSETVIGFMLDVIPSSEPESWLRKNQLIQNQKPTVAGIILFADLPQAILPKRSGIKIYRYKTDQSEGTRETLVGNPLTVEGNSYIIIYEAVQVTQEIINGVQILGSKGLETVVYPTETLHEVITNAVLHRDYSIADDVHIRIYDNRVEVESPGRLPAHITVENILNERFARNGNLVRIINKFPNPPNKDVGEGLNTAFAAMRNLRLKDPIIYQNDNSVVVHIKHEKLASAEDIIMEYLETNEKITNSIARKLTGIKSENSMKGVLWRLRDRNMIEMVPGLSGFKSAWRKKNSE